MGTGEQAIEIRIGRKHRIGFYVCIPTCGLAISTFGWMIVNDVGRTFAFIGMPFFVLMIVQSFAWLKWRLFIDRNGIRTKLYRMGNSWTWEDFASGHIRKLGDTILDPNRPVLHQTLNLHMLGEEDRQRVLCSINAFYELPPAPELPKKLTFKFGFRRNATLSGKGIRIRQGKTTKKYAWDEVQHVCIMREEPRRRDFTFLGIVLPDREIAWDAGAGSQQAMEQRELINEFLCDHLPPEKIEIGVDGKQTTSRFYLERKINAVKREMRRYLLEASAAVLLFVLGAAGYFATGDFIVHQKTLTNVGEFLMFMAAMQLGRMIKFAMTRGLLKQLKLQLDSLGQTVANSSP